MRVPEDVSVAGFGGYDVGAVVYPALTTVAFDFELVGMNVAQRMLELLEGRLSGDAVSLPFFFVERESVRRIGENRDIRQSFAGMA